ncbi:MAG: hypothetical protein KF850_32525 [Labilithrix sp.]|nr:hypothetical protein [Labilithrix sp.]
MSERVHDQQAPPPEVAVTPPPGDAGEHWRGYPGEPEASSYGVPARSSYGLLFALLLFGAMLVALAFMTMHDW